MSRYIDSDAFEKYLNREEWKTPDEKWWPEREIGMIIDAIPTADVKPVVRGEWIVKGQEVYCSACNQLSAYTWHGASKFSNYCPNCGADMRGGENE